MAIPREEMFFMLLTRVSGLVDWLIIAVLHLALISAALWWWQVTPQAAGDAIQRLAQSRHVAFLGLLGLSAATAVGLWLRLCFLATRKLTSRYVWRPVHERLRES